MGLGARRTPYAHHLRLPIPRAAPGSQAWSTPQRTHRPRVHRLRLEQHRSDILAGGLPALTPTREPRSSLHIHIQCCRHVHTRPVRTSVRTPRSDAARYPPRHPVMPTSFIAYLLARRRYARTLQRETKNAPRHQRVPPLRTLHPPPETPRPVRAHTPCLACIHTSPPGTHVPPARTQSGPKDVRSPRTRRPDSARRPRRLALALLSCYDTTAHDVSNPIRPPPGRPVGTHAPAHPRTHPPRSRRLGSPSSFVIVTSARTAPRMPQRHPAHTATGRIPPPHPHTRHDHLVIPTRRRLAPTPLGSSSSSSSSSPSTAYTAPTRLEGPGALALAPASHVYRRIHHDIPAHPTAHPTRLEDASNASRSLHRTHTPPRLVPGPYRTRGLEYLRALAPRRPRTTRDPATISRPGADHSDPPALTRSQCCRQQMVRVESKIRAPLWMRPLPEEQDHSSRSLDDSGGVHHLAAHADDDESVPEKSSAQRTRTLLLPCHTRGYALNATP
ncbi:hypothetical protein C8F04DRAFT_1277756 [Mycena alexandri]|uniref:Uncharacterized protein n=1 Tax=Mycena alexandri TaxID=1745969 RepID=A0AAD6S1Y5_9AGAR|nr:hypothetical protein C8F04DRAFT_1277756 [Mycena alexandri]